MTPQTMPGGVAFRAKDGAVAIVALLALGPSCCARHRAAPPASTPSEWSLRVENNHWLDVTVYVVHGGQSTRVGLVTATTTQNFVLPAHLLGPGGDVQLAAHAVGSGERIESELITISGGQLVEWTLERALRHGSVSVH